MWVRNPCVSSGGGLAGPGGRVSGPGVCYLLFVFAVSAVDPPLLSLLPWKQPTSYPHWSYLPPHTDRQTVPAQGIHM